MIKTTREKMLIKKTIDQLSCSPCDFCAYYLDGSCANNSNTDCVEGIYEYSNQEHTTFTS